MTRELLIKGNVQGVGMRYFIKDLAVKLGVFGTVKNLSNGSVECVIQGDEALLERFVKALKNEAPGYIDKLETETLKTEKKYQAFDIIL